MSLIRNNQVFISKGVLMKSEWVLRYRYKFPREQIAAFVQSVLDASNTLIEDEPEDAVGRVRVLARNPPCADAGAECQRRRVTLG